jgi:hypothetical protein
MLWDLFFKICQFLLSPVLTILTGVIILIDTPLIN